MAVRALDVVPNKLLGIKIPGYMATNSELPMVRYFPQLLRTWLGLLWGILGPIVLFVGFLFAMSSNTPWVYHPILFMTLMVPAFFMARHAISGRSNASSWSARITNSLGTGFLSLSAAIFALGYCFAIYTKIQG